MSGGTALISTADQYRFRHATFAVSSNVVNDLAATGGVPDVDGVTEIEMGSQRSQVVGVVVHIVTVAGLCGASVSPPVMGDHAVAAVQEEQHLGVPVVGRKRPAVAEDDRLARAPVLVEDLCSIGRGDRAHAVPTPKRSFWQRNLTFCTPGQLLPPW
jgi:hypothetical protein